MKPPIQLHKLLNQILELSCKEFTTEQFLKKSLRIILSHSFFLGFNKSGIIFVVKEPNTLKMLAYKNIEKSVIEKCNEVKFGSCACSIAAQKNDINFSSCTSKNNKLNLTTEGHYSIPISYNNKVYAVISLYIHSQITNNQDNVVLIKTIADTMGLIVYKKRLEKYAEIIKSKFDLLHGDKYFYTLAKYLTKELNMKYCLIGSFQPNSFSVKTYAFVDDKKNKPNITYSLSDTPCEDVYKNAPFICIEQNVMEQFPNDVYLQKLNAQSYLGIRLENDKKEPVGIIVLLNDKPTYNLLEKKEIVNVFAPRLTSECERKRIEIELNIEKNKYKDVFEKFQDVFVRTQFTDDGKSTFIAEVSPSIQRLTGFKSTELIGKSWNDFPNEFNRDEIINMLFLKKEVRDFPLTLVKKNGEKLKALVNAQLITDKKGKPIEIRSVFRDVTEKNVEELRKEVSYLIAKKSQRQLVNFNSLSEYVYLILKPIIDTSNFYIALSNEENNTIDFTVFIDQKHTNYSFSHSSVIKNGLIECQLKGKAMYVQTQHQLSEIIKKYKLDYTDPLPKVMVTFPLKCDSRITGVLTIKSYENEKAFSQHDIDLLEFISTQLSNILERDKWQKNIIAKEKYFRELVEKSNEVTGIINNDGIIQYITASVFSILGFQSYELIGKNFYDLVPDYLYNTVIDNFERMLIHKKNSTTFIKLQAKNKQIRIIQFTLNNQLKNKEINGIIFNANDVTEQLTNNKKLEQSKTDLIQQENNYRTIFNHANDGIMRFNTDFKIIDTNKRMSSILGYSKNELLTKTILDLTLPKDIDNIQKRMNLLITGKISSVKIEKESVHKKGKKVVCKVFVKPVYNNDNTINYFIAFITDITKRNEAINNAMEFEYALNSVSNVLYVDLKGKIFYSNEKNSKSSGYSQNELIGKPMSIFNSNYHSKEFFSSLWKTVLAGKIWTGEIRNKKKDGSIFWIFGTIIPIKNLNNEIVHFINVRQDITELKNNRLNKVRDVIDAQEKEKESFAKELHDGLGQMLLATKMNLASIESELKENGGLVYDIYQNAIKILNESIQEARNISHGLMSRALIQFGLTQAIFNIVNSINLINPNINIQFNSAIETNRFNEDIEKGLYRVIQELLSNLIKHSEASFAKIELKIEDNNLIVKYTDNGVGICNNLLNLSKPLGIGIKNMETRVNYLMGSFIINEELTSGTEIVIKIPV